MARWWPSSSARCWSRVSRRAGVAPDPAPARAGTGVARIAPAAALLLPALITLYLSFRGGGFFAGEPAQLAVLLALLLVARVTLAEQPFAGFGRRLAVPGIALGLFVVWTLVSALWSDAPGRALIEFDRALAYWLALVLFGSLAGSPTAPSWALRGVAIAFWVVCAVGFASRALPEVWPITPNIVNERLSYPLTYWNALGLLAALALLAALHYGSSEREPPGLRILGAAAAPVAAATLVFTFSRGAIAVGAITLVLYLLLARPWGAAAGLLTVLPAAAVGAIAAYRADLLATKEPTTAAAVAQGHNVALAVGVATLAAALLRFLLLRLDRRLAQIQLAPRVRGTAWAAAAVLTLAALVVGLTALHGGDALQRQYDRFVQGGKRGSSHQLRSRLTNPGNNGRLDNWEVALDAFRGEPVHGTGAGTYATEWTRRRKIGLDVHDGHSLYLEVMAELGVVGLVLLAVSVLAILAALAAGLRGRRRHLHAALLAAAVAWALHAGLDWDWEMPAITVWLFALAGLCLARPAREAAVATPARFTRVAIAAGCLALAASPALVALSQARLNSAVAGFKRGDCGQAIDSALASIKAMWVRPEPYELLSYCDARRDRHSLALRTAGRMVELDPSSWEAYYTLALARANARLDPRAAALRAYRLNPRDQRARYALRYLARNRPNEWRRRAREARLPLQ